MPLEYGELIEIERRARLAHTQRSYPEAVSAYEEALRVARGLARPRLEGVLHDRLGLALEAQGQVHEALLAHRAALAVLSGDAAPDLAPLLAETERLSRRYCAQCWPVLIDLVRMPWPEDLAQAEEDPWLVHRLLLDLGHAYLRQPAWQAAQRAYDLAWERTATAPECPTVLALRRCLLTQRALLAANDGERDRARDLLKEVMSGVQGQALRHSLLVRAELEIRGELGPEATLSCQQALALYEQGDDALGRGRTLARLGHLLLRQVQYGQARAVLRQAVDLSRDHEVETYWYACYGLGACLRESGGPADLPEAAGLLLDSLMLLNLRGESLGQGAMRLAFLDSVQDVYDQMVAVLLDAARTEPRFYTEALRTAEYARCHASLRYLPAIDTALRTEDPFASGIRGLVMTDLRRLASEPRTPEIFPLPDVKVHRLVFHDLADRTAVFAVDPEGAVHSSVVPLGREALTALVTRLRDALHADDAPRGIAIRNTVRQRPKAAAPGNEGAVLRELYDLLIAPLVAHLPPEGTPLILEPHGPLWLVPFCALLDPDGRYLCDRWPLLHEYSALTLHYVRLAKDPGGPRDLPAVIVGNPTMPAVAPRDGLDVALLPLAGAEEEARRIAALWPGASRKLLIGQQADRLTVEKEMAAGGCVHLATHGVVYPGDPLQSAVALADPPGGAPGDGLLTAERVLNLDVPADLVVLSACQSGMGRLSCEGLLGLTRAFLWAGARNILASLWNISDQSTAELMTAFYRHYTAGVSKVVALQRAMREYRAEHPEHGVLLWAPFILIGGED